MPRNENETGEMLWEQISRLKHGEDPASVWGCDPAARNGHDADDLAPLVTTLHAVLQEENAATGGLMSARMRLQQAISADMGAHPTPSPGKQQQPLPPLRLNRLLALFAIVTALLLSAIEVGLLATGHHTVSSQVEYISSFGGSDSCHH
ncbi:MAG TPA: hypothetical protein VKU00_00275, partial [Chthonomonadaceae bacterium]|nr:hypothetical protein [Chthonomonadaceae bacterium]